MGRRHRLEYPGFSRLSNAAREHTYNAYLVVADKITLIDTVKAPFREG